MAGCVSLDIVLAGVLAVAACGGDDGAADGNGPTDDGGSTGSSSNGDTTDNMSTADGGTDSGTDRGTDSGTDGTESSTGDDTTSTTGSSDSGSESGSTGAIVPVVCGDVECEAGELCVEPGANCDLSPCDLDPPEDPDFSSGPPFCAPVPEACEADDEMCLADELCSYFGDSNLAEGVLHCPSEGKDCYCP